MRRHPSSFSFQLLTLPNPNRFYPTLLPFRKPPSPSDHLPLPPDAEWAVFPFCQAERAFPFSRRPQRNVFPSLLTTPSLAGLPSPQCSRRRPWRVCPPINAHDAVPGGSALPSMLTTPSPAGLPSPQCSRRRPRRVGLKVKLTLTTLPPFPEHCRGRQTEQQGG